MKEFVNKIVSLDNIKQWEERDSFIKESVSQHSFKVSAICIFLLEKINKKDLNTFNDFKLKCIEYSVLHDFDESIIGRDIGHTIKYNVFNGEKIRNVINQFVKYELMNKNFDFIFRDFEDKNIKSFCKLCDWIALYTFVKRNEDMGIKGFEKEKIYCLKNIELKRIECEKILFDFFKIDFSFKNLINNLIK